MRPLVGSMNAASGEHVVVLTLRRWIIMPCFAVKAFELRSGEALSECS
jgi:hypothetical protein